MGSFPPLHSSFKLEYALYLSFVPSDRHHFYAFHLSQWTFLAASLLVIFGCVFSVFQTQTSLPKQSTYAPVIVMGSGMSIMYLMALTFATELTGKDKVRCYYSNHKLLEDDRTLRAN